MLIFILIQISEMHGAGKVKINIFITWKPVNSFFLKANQLVGFYMMPLVLNGLVLYLFLLSEIHYNIVKSWHV